MKNVSSNYTCREGCSCDYHNTDTEHCAARDSWTATVISVSNKQLPEGGASQTLHTLNTGSYKGNLRVIVSILNTQSMQLVTMCNSLVPRQPGNEVKVAGM